MRHLRTKLATEGGADPSAVQKVLRWALTRVLPDANPDYRFDLLHEWLVEFDDEGLPGREVGLGADGEPVFSGPNDRNYGFWLDTHMTIDDFEGEPVDAEVFEVAWRRSAG